MADLDGDEGAVVELFQTGRSRFAKGTPDLVLRLMQSFLGDPCGGQDALTVDTVKQLTVPASANSCVLSVEAQSARMKVDGQPPTATTGLLLQVGSIITLTGRATLQAAQFIGTVAGSILQIQYFT